MGEIRDLTLNVKANTEGLKDISAAGKKTASDLQKQNRVEGSIKRGGRLGSAVQDASAKRLN